MKLVGLVACARAAAVSVPSIAAPAMPAPAQVTRLGGVRIGVADFDKSIKFYTALGMVSGDRYNDREHQMKPADPTQGAEMILYLKNANSRLKLGPGSMAFVVKDIRDTVRKLRAAGFPNIGEPQDRQAVLLMSVEDPDGNQVEIAQIVPQPAK